MPIRGNMMVIRDKYSGSGGQASCPSHRAAGFLKRVRWRLLFAALVSVALEGTSAPAKIITVDWQSSGQQDGTEAHPFGTVSQALANTARDDIISIRTGLYYNQGGPLIFNQRSVVRAENGPVKIGGSPSVESVCSYLAKVTPLKPTISAPLVLGSYDAAADSFTWNQTSQFFTKRVVVEPDPDNPHPLKPKILIEHHARVVDVVPSIQINLANNSENISFSANRKTSVVPAGASAAILEGPFTDEINFTLSVGTRAMGGQLFLHASPLLEAGCLVIEALPVAIIYQPPTGTGKLITSDTTGVALTKFISDAFSNPTPGTISDAQAALHAFGDFLSTIGSALGAEGGKTGGKTGPSTSNAGAAIGALGSALNTLADSVGAGDGSGPSWAVQVHSDRTIEVTAKTTEIWSAVPQLGPGSGDLILYLRNVRFLVYKDNNITLITPVGFEGQEIQDVTAARLRPGADAPPALSESSRAMLLAEDPVASGKPGAVMPGPRYVHVRNFHEENPGAFRELQWGYTVTDATVEEMFSAPNPDTGLTVGIASKFNRRGRTITASVEAVGPFDFDIYYDVIFGTFAYQGRH